MHRLLRWSRRGLLPLKTLRPLQAQAPPVNCMPARRMSGKAYVFDILEGHFHVKYGISVPVLMSMHERLFEDYPIGFSPKEAILEAVGSDASHLAQQVLSSMTLEEGRYDTVEFLSCLSSITLRESPIEFSDFNFDIWTDTVQDHMTLEEFVTFYACPTRHGCQVRRSKITVAHELFQYMDSDDDGLITKTEFRRGVLSTASLKNIEEVEATSAMWDPCDPRLHPWEVEVMELLGEKQRVPLARALATDWGDHIFYLLDGGVEVVHGETKLLDVGAGDFIGEASLLDSEYPFYGSAFATKPTHVIRIPTKDLATHILHDHPGSIMIMQRLMRLIYQRSEALEKMEESKSVTYRKKFTAFRDRLRVMWALNNHQAERSGKFSTIPSRYLNNLKQYTNVLSMGYSEPCVAIQQHPPNAYQYTRKGNSVAIISDGSHILNLGNVGPLPAKPVLEGKVAMYKILGGVDGVDLALAAPDLASFSQTIEAVSPSFGALCVSDVSPPNCFELQEILSDGVGGVPCLFQLRDGTALVAAAGVLNGLHRLRKKIEDVKVSVSATSSWSVCVTNHLIQCGMRPENVTFYVDEEDKRPQLTQWVGFSVTEDPIIGVKTACEGSDVLIGSGQAAEAACEVMTRRPMFVIGTAALFHPTLYPTLLENRPGCILLTNRPEFPNYINDLVSLIPITRAVLDTRATTINDTMRFAAVTAIRSLTPAEEDDFDGDDEEEVIKKNWEDRYQLGRKPLVPKAHHPLLIPTVATAVAKAAVETSVAQYARDMDSYYQQLLGEVNSMSKHL